MTDPQIIWMDNGTWGKCPDCDEELYKEVVDAGVHHECMNCGHLWWEGEFLRDADGRPNS